MSKEDLKGKCIVITGASSGFGKGSALQFAELGSNVVLAARRTDLLDELAAGIQKTGARAPAGNGRCYARGRCCAISQCGRRRIRPHRCLGEQCRSWSYWPF